MTTSRSAVDWSAGMAALLFLQFLGDAGELVEALLPEAPIAAEPAGGARQWRGGQADRSELRAAPARDQPGALQHLQVLRNGRLAEGEWRHQFVDCGVAAREPRQDRPA